MPFRSTNLGRTNLWVPSLLLMLAVAVFWVLTSDPNENPDPAKGRSSSQRESSLELEPIASAVLEKVDLPLDPVRDDLSYQPKFGIVRGRVVAAHWVIWPQAITVSLIPQSGGEAIGISPASEEAPTFRFERVPFGNYTLKLTATECLDQELLLTLSPEQNNHFASIAVVPAASVIGVVVDEMNQPVEKIPVAVVLRSNNPGASQVPLTSLTDENGQFRITGLRDGEFNVYVGSFRNPLSEIQVIGISREAPEAYVSFTVTKMGRATVTVDFLDGTEAAAEDWLTMRVLATRSGEGLGFSGSLPLGENGQVVFTALPPGNYSFSAYGGPYRKVIRQASVNADSPTAVTIPMRRFK
ncbi:MAG: carboxypeptidase-like regulatory domain-containing protein [Planctomycetota bacterium]|nr:carboxypeptidase-like regulatory domain-containing protein [Planctomycetota bacterium]